MNEPIKVGDLIMIVKPSLCCGCRKTIGHVHTVVRDADRLPFGRCTECGHSFAHSQETSVKLDNGNYILRTRLKRIPPLTEPEGVEHKEELPA